MNEPASDKNGERAARNERVRRALGTTLRVAPLVFVACSLAHLSASQVNGFSWEALPERWARRATLVVNDGSVLGALAFVCLADLALLAVAWAAFRALGEPLDGPVEAADTVVALVITGTLWAVLLGLVRDLVLAGPFEPADYRLDVTAKFAALVPLVVAKEALYRYLEGCRASTGSLLLGALAWHHRKDGLFNGLLVLAIVAGLAGVQPEAVSYLCLYLKLLLLGTATVGLSLQLLERLGRAAPPEGGERP